MLLLELRVRDIGIIEDISWSLGPGLNIVTGETGAGKSLVIDAVEALLGSKPDEEIVRHGADEALIEGVFSLPQDINANELRALLADIGVIADDDTLVIHCELRRRGRSVIRVNGRAVTRGILQQLGRLLIDVHGQSDHLSLLDRRRHLSFLDAYARNETGQLLPGFSSLALELQQVETGLAALTENEQELARREEFLHYQVDEIDRAELHPGEEEELERERNILGSTELLKTLSYEAYQKLYGEDTADLSASAADLLNEAITAMTRLAELDPEMKPQLDITRDALYSLEAAAQEVHAYSDRLEHNPGRLGEVEIRLDLIRDLKRKYGQNIESILDYRAKAAAELDGIAHSSEKQAELETARSHLRQEIGGIASKLSLGRRQAAGQLKAAVEKELADLNMPQVDFQVSVIQVADADGIPYPDGECYAFDRNGADSIEFMASTNPGEPLKPLAKIASTGEISRFMLALKGALSAADNIPVLVFDEIDIGVGGRSGEVVGRKLWRLARDHQIICITHLPQIAALADAHYHIHKEVTGDRTLSQLETIEGDARVEELAAMLSGPRLTSTSLENAREMIERAEDWKGAELNNRATERQP